MACVLLSFKVTQGVNNEAVFHVALRSVDFSQTHLGLGLALTLNGHVTMGNGPVSLSLGFPTKMGKMPSSCRTVVRTKQSNVCFPQSVVPERWKVFSK